MDTEEILAAGLVDYLNRYGTSDLYNTLLAMAEKIEELEATIDKMKAITHPLGD